MSKQFLKSNFFFFSCRVSILPDCFNFRFKFYEVLEPRFSNLLHEFFHFFRINIIPLYEEVNLFFVNIRPFMCFFKICFLQKKATFSPKSNSMSLRKKTSLVNYNSNPLFQDWRKEKKGVFLAFP